jgi:hypothetical protein
MGQLKRVLGVDGIYRFSCAQKVKRRPGAFRGGASAGTFSPCIPSPASSWLAVPVVTASGRSVAERVYAGVTLSREYSLGPPSLDDDGFFAQQLA